MLHCFNYLETIDASLDRICVTERDFDDLAARDADAALYEKCCGIIS